MERRLAEHLRRVGQADRILARGGHDPRPFLLLYSGGMQRSVNHPGWDESWPTPVAEDVDDLEELGMLRTEAVQNAKRLFSLTVQGRREAEALAEPLAQIAGGRAPDLDATLAWLVDVAEEAPEILDLPTRAIDRAISDDFILPTGREAFAARIVDLYDQGYLSGDLPNLDQVNAAGRLNLSEGLRLTMKAHERVERRNAPQGNSVTFNGPVIADQIAAGDITNYTTFGDLLDRAAVAIGDLDQVDKADREEALGLVALLRGKALDLTGAALSGAGGTLLAGVIARLLGLPV